MVWGELLESIVLGLPAPAKTTYVPREFTAGDGTVITLYEPQFQELAGNDLGK